MWPVVAYNKPSRNPSASNATKPISRNIRLLGWFNFWAEFRPYGPIAILYYSQVTGSYALGMSLFSAAMLSQSIFELPTGLFSDLIGRKWTVVCGGIAGVLALTTPP